MSVSKVDVCAVIYSLSHASQYFSTFSYQYYIDISSTTEEVEVCAVISSLSHASPSPSVRTITNSQPSILPEKAQDDGDSGHYHDVEFAYHEVYQDALSVDNLT